MRVPARLEAVNRVVDASNLTTRDTKSQVDRQVLADWTLKLALQEVKEGRPAVV